MLSTPGLPAESLRASQNQEMLVRESQSRKNPQSFVPPILHLGKLRLAAEPGCCRVEKGAAFRWSSIGNPAPSFASSTTLDKLCQLSELSFSICTQDRIDET